MKPYISVIIPTFNRRAKLEKCLDAISEQTLAQDAYEVIVVNDGSQDETETYLNGLTDHQNNLTVIHQKNSGQGIARNNAIKHANGQILVFIGDDIYLTETYLETVSKFHKSNPEMNYACLGLTLWYPDAEITDFMDWLTNGGPQFNYNIEPNEETDFWHFYTSNISIKKEIYEDFDKRFKGYGWEDIELAYRLTKNKNLKIIFTPTALAFHDDPMEEKQLKDRMISIAKNAKVFESLHPELKVIPTGMKKIILAMISSLPVLVILWPFTKISTFLKRKYWYLISKRYFLQGLNSV